MSSLPEALLAGYRRFRAGRYPEQQVLFSRLAQGQAPRVAILACADSRADPALIFDAAPGELFVLRNVANLVPAFEGHGTSHGTSAGLEFAVTQLQVADLVVMGHAACGGIEACLRSATEELPGRFLGRWVALAAEARDAVMTAAPMLRGEALQRAVEQRAVVHSLRRLTAFPFVADAMAAERLRLHGAWFSIRSGELSWFDQARGSFVTVTAP